jgi:hypothetical protein
MALLWLAGLGTANAILVRGSIDPQFSTSGTLAELYWTADVVFDIGSGCLSPDSTVTCAISNLGVTGTLQYVPSSGTPGPVLNVDFLQYDPSPPTSLNLAVDSQNSIIGIGSGVIGYAGVDMRPSLDIGNVWVQFFLPGSDPNFQDATFASGGLIVQPCIGGTDPDEDRESQIAEEHENEGNESIGACNASASPDGALTSSLLGRMTITQVPEPGSAWLVAGALLIAAPLVARRKLSA